jgi:hypothetical protein
MLQGLSLTSSLSKTALPPRKHTSEGTSRDNYCAPGEGERYALCDLRKSSGGLTLTVGHRTFTTDHEV